jgi:hypothetical protein
MNSKREFFRQRQTATRPASSVRLTVKTIKRNPGKDELLALHSASRTTVLHTDLDLIDNPL